MQFYRFILLDISEAGRHSDGGVQSHSVFGMALETNTLTTPPSAPLTGNSFCIENTAIFIYEQDISMSLPYVIVGNEAFPLH